MKRSQIIIYITKMILDQRYGKHTAVTKKLILELKKARGMCLLITAPVV